MMFTIEPMITVGDWRHRMWDDDWTAVTVDGRRSAQFEHTHPRHRRRRRDPDPAAKTAPGTVDAGAEVAKAPEPATQSHPEVLGRRVVAYDRQHRPEVLGSPRSLGCPAYDQPDVRDVQARRSGAWAHW